ncbi:DUF2809 domain-containing protein [Ferruginibacter lapsinanis]|uniref:ribosomal maturation YjgA family protein n=1 Tax=Ferruginibacter lapsinanis TaxID=563172 RepID=UPI001E2BBC53|nr:DUF2809 domain-containing protein [Ferruginibacter lapsinanis]UEG49401.1 DUF2809 domain-containing protein [Ferruginibacter lapsinanis]
MNQKIRLNFNGIFLVAFIGLFLIEVAIAKYFFDALVRAFVGDVLVVIMIYCFCRIFLNGNTKKIALGVFLFACTIEILQAFNFVKLLGVENNTILSIALGSTFDWKDILAYLIGCIICLVIK